MPRNYVPALFAITKICGPIGRAGYWVSAIWLVSDRRGGDA